jgi:type II secretory pathway pseudopilin PulG
MRLRMAEQLCRAFTLVEVLLVLVLLVMIGAISVPVMTGSFEREKVMNAGDVVRSAWSKARLTAMETGQPHVFRCELKAGRFHVVSMAEYIASGGAPPAGEATAEDEPGSPVLDFTRLPTGVVFASGEFAPTPQLSAMTGAGADPAWSEPIVFQPDGTCSDATLLLANENNYTVRVTLRGIMATARIADIGVEAVQQ